MSIASNMRWVPNEGTLDLADYHFPYRGRETRKGSQIYVFRHKTHEIPYFLDEDKAENPAKDVFCATVHEQERKGQRPEAKAIVIGDLANGRTEQEIEEAVPEIYRMSRVSYPWYSLGTGMGKYDEMNGFGNFYTGLAGLGACGSIFAAYFVDPWLLLGLPSGLTLAGFMKEICKKSDDIRDSRIRSKYPFAAKFHYGWLANLWLAEQKEKIQREEAKHAFHEIANEILQSRINREVTKEQSLRLRNHRNEARQLHSSVNWKSEKLKNMFKEYDINDIGEIGQVLTEFDSALRG